MDRMPLLALFLQSMPEGFIVNALGLLLVGHRPRLARLALAAVITSTVSYFVRALPLPFGLHTLILVAVTVVVLMVTLRVSWRVAVLSVFIGVTLLALGEGISIPLMTSLTGVPMEKVIASTWLRIVFPLPHMTVLGVLVWCCWRYKWAIVRIDNAEDDELPF